MKRGQKRNSQKGGKQQLKLSLKPKLSLKKKPSSFNNGPDLNSSMIDPDVNDVASSDILSQDFFCTPDYITPECQNLFSDLDGIKENIACPASPEKLKTVKSKIFKKDIFAKSPTRMLDDQHIEELSKETSYMDDYKAEKTTVNESCKGPRFVPQSAIALRCRVTPPPCLKNPYIKDAVEMDVDPFGSWRTKCSGYLSASTGTNSMSRYRSDFQEIEENLGVASRLDLLKGFHQEELSFSSEDEVEVPDFDKRKLDNKNIRCDQIGSKDKDYTCDKDEWILGAKKERKTLVKSTKSGASVFEGYDLYTKEGGKQFEPCTSSPVHKESGRLDHWTENVRWPMVYSKVSPGKGGRCKTKTRSSQLESHKQGGLWSVWKDMDPNSGSDDESLEEVEALEFQSREKTSPFHERSLALSTKEALQQDHCRHSMAELLDDLQGNFRNPYLKSKKGRRKSRQIQHSIIRRTSSLGKNIMSNEDPCELIHGESSTDSEENAKSSKFGVKETGSKTMADKFQDAFGCALADNTTPFFVLPKQSSTGLFGRLQNIMQGQKEKDAEFLKKVQTEVWPKDGAIDVKIISRSFDAKLSVCRCSLLENEESSLENPQQEDFGRIWTVIFSARVCGDVDLEVGNSIRIFPPWKEVQVIRGGEIIILASYFSQIHT